MKIGAIQPPRLVTVDEGERSATWLELFYDLVFVAAVAMLGVRLATDASWNGWMSYVAYFVLIWWLWASHTFYADRFDTDDLVYRLLAFLQMVSIAFLAASLSTDDAGSTAMFAAAYAAARIILLIMYARAYRHVEVARTLVRGYLIGFGAGAVLWTLSIFVPEPARFVLWAMALAIDLATPYIIRKEQARVPLDVSHLPERFGLFTILVLGETIVAVTLGLSHVSWQVATSIAGIFGIAIATGLWWIHFDNVDGFVVRRRGDEKTWRPTVWIYTHAPLAIGIAMVGIGVEHAIIAADADHSYHTEERWVLVGGAIIALAAMSVIEIASNRQAGEVVRRRIVGNRVLSIPVLAIIGILALGPAITVILVAAVMAIQVVADVLAGEIRADDPEAEELDTEEFRIDQLPAEDTGPDETDSSTVEEEDVDAEGQPEEAT
ncbi:MAG: low temperature requirement protein A [Acidimicrobiia bacterium]